jgi:flagellar basal body rod protein FlgG
LVTQQGWPVQGSGGDITITGKAVQFGQDGTVNVDGQAIGKLRVVEINPTDVQHESGTLFKLIEGASATDSTKPVVRGGAIEASNVNAVRELTDMILASKIFESFSQVDSASSRMTQARNQYLGTQA